MVYELVFAVIFLGLIGYGMLVRTRSANELEALAKSLGATFNGGTTGFGPHSAFPAMPESALLSEFTGQASWVVTGRLPAVDYHLFNYSASPGETSYSMTVVLLKADILLPVPPFHLHPADLRDLNCFKFHDQQVDLPEYPRFRQLFVLRSPAPAVRTAFDAPVAAFFEQHAGVCVEKFGPYLAYYRFETRVQTGEGRAFFDEALALFGVLTAAGARVRH